jgi:hypothetical protein
MSVPEREINDVKFDAPRVKHGKALPEAGYRGLAAKYLRYWDEFADFYRV